MSDAVSPPSGTDSIGQWLDFWTSNHDSAIDLGLDRVRRVLSAMEIPSTDPQRTTFTVAGTNGKGSTTSLISAMTAAAGYRVGLYQSPHLYSYNERIKINNQPVSDRQLVDAFVAVNAAREKLGLTLSYFEAGTLAAIYLFQREQCQVWVLEVGLGGRLDATNIIDPDIAVITGIDFDHTEYLGHTLPEITREKAGILRPGIPVVYGESRPNAELEQICITGQNRLLQGGRQYLVRPGGRGGFYASPSLSLALPSHSLALENAGTAITACLISSLNVPVPAVLTGVAAARLPGRFEQTVINERTLIFDAAHNPAGMRFLMQQLEELRQQQPEGRLFFVFSMLADKNIEEVVAIAAPAVDQWYIAPLTGPRGLDNNQLATRMQALNRKPVKSDTVAQALHQALEQSRPGDIIVACGSFLVLEALRGVNLESD